MARCWGRAEQPARVTAASSSSLTNFCCENAKMSRGRGTASLMLQQHHPSTIPAPFQHHPRQAGRIPAFPTAPAFLQPTGMYFLILSDSKTPCQGQGSTGRGASPSVRALLHVHAAEPQNHGLQGSHAGTSTLGSWGSWGFVWTCRLLTLRSTNSWKLRKPRAGAAWMDFWEMLQFQSREEKAVEK